MINKPTAIDYQANSASRYPAIDDRILPRTTMVIPPAAA